MKLLIALLLTGFGAYAEAADNKPDVPLPTLQDFAWQQTLSVAEQQSAYRLGLPIEVYAGCRRNDLGDIRIFNAAGELLPYAFLTPPPPPPNKLETIALPYFSVRSDTRNSNSLIFDLHQAQDGRLSSVRVETAGGTADASKFGSYVIDASSLKKPLTALITNWSTATDTVLAINVEGSDNLQDWRLLKSNVQLMNLQLGEHRLIKDRIELDASRHRYFRLSWDKTQTGINLTKVYAETSATSPTTKALLWSAAVAIRVGETSGEYLFENDGLPVEQIQIALLQINTVAPYRLFHRRDSKDSWHEVASTVAYRFNRNGQEIVAPEVKVGLNRSRYWRLLVDQRGGGFGQGLPTIRLGWTPQQLLFVARGAAPFTLAYGNNKLTSASYDAATLLPGFHAEQINELPVATIGAPNKLVAPAAAIKADKANSNNKLLLWAVLLLGVAILGAMVWRLVSQMNKSEP